MAAWFRLAWQLQRLELTLLAAAALFVIAGLLWLAWQASTIIGTDASCFYHGDPGAVPLESPSCQALRLLFSQRITWEQTLNLGLLATAAPFVLGSLLGVPVVAREIEHRTAGIAWSLARSRSVWLLQRLLPVALFLVAALGLIGLAGTWFEASRFATGFWRDYHPWPLLVARGLLALSLGVVCGALLGRVLSGLLLTALACAVFLPIGVVMDRWMAAEAVPVAIDDVRATVGARVFGTGLREDATGRILTPDEYLSAPDGSVVIAFDPAPGITPVEFVVPASRYAEFTLREAALTAALAVLTTGAGFAIVRRRRPS